MATYVFNNKRNTVDIVCTGTDTITISGNDSVSEIAIPGQTVLGASIRQLWCSSPSGNSSYWTIARGANVVFAPDSTAYIDFAGNGSGLNLFADQNLTVTLVAAGENAGSIMLSLHKITEMPDNSDY